MGLHRDITISLHSKTECAETLQQLDEEIEKEAEILQRIMEDVSNRTGYEFDDNGDSFAVYDASWEDVDDDMIEISQRFPGQVIAVDCEGGNDDDYWIGYFKDGKKQTCEREVSYPPYDETKLS